MAVAFTANLAGDGELGGIFAILAEQVGEEAATCVDEPVTYLGREEEILALTTELILAAYMDVLRNRPTKPTSKHSISQIHNSTLASHSQI